MEKIIDINGKKIKLKECARNVLVYQAQFGEDIFRSVEMILKTFTTDGTVLENLDTLKLYRLIWTMAKCADDSVKPFDAWIDEVEEIPVIDMGIEIQDLLLGFITSKSKIKSSEKNGERAAG